MLSGLALLTQGKTQCLLHMEDTSREPLELAAYKAQIEHTVGEIEDGPLSESLKLS